VSCAVLAYIGCVYITGAVWSAFINDEGSMGRDDMG